MRHLSACTGRELKGKRVLVRINLDLKNPEPNSPRIRRAIPTITFLLTKGAHPVIMSHNGRPQGTDPSLSLKPAIDILTGLIGTELEYLENLRFDPREQANDESFARELARKGDIYVNDDFATSHRICASIVGVPRFLPAYAGLQFEKELESLTRVRDNPELPLVVVIGGVKIADKTRVIHNLAHHGTKFLLGSAYEIMRETLPNGAKIVMPVDYADEDRKHLDIGPRTAELYAGIITNAKTVIWSGPVGWAENEEYATGSRAIAKAIGASTAFSVAGGGDTADFLERTGLGKHIDFISTGGGAMLAFLGGEALPGIVALEAD